MFEETPKIDFTVKDENGIVIFRDALIFKSIAEMRNTSSSEREAMMQQRYEAWQNVINNPDSGEQPQTGEE